MSVLRGGMRFEQAGLVAAFSGATAERRAARRAEDWLEVGRHMRREGCCDPETGRQVPQSALPKHYPPDAAR